MSAAEKKLNNKDLQAYKNYDHTDHAMIPGIQNTSKMGLTRIDSKSNSLLNSPEKKAR
jgi:hypothetical protein